MRFSVSMADHCTFLLVSLNLYTIDYDRQLANTCSDIIISDVNMPVENGLDFIKGLIDIGCKVKFRALMSAEWMESDLEHAESMGCRVFNKPFNLYEMLKLLANCRKQIDEKGELSDWPTKIKSGS